MMFSCTQLKLGWYELTLVIQRQSPLYSEQNLTRNVKQKPVERGVSTTSEKDREQLMRSTFTFAYLEQVSCWKAQSGSAMKNACCVADCWIVFL
jgi:hypothetical protein